jgi:LL-diaminopimelate aminotransferase
MKEQKTFGGMTMTFSKLVTQDEGNIYQTLEQKRLTLVEQGVDVINLSVGTPDAPPAPHVMMALSNAATNPDNYKYSLNDLPELKEAVQSWYDIRYNVELSENEIMGIYGTQEGFAHIFLTICDPGDTIIVGTPGYPIFSFGAQLAGVNIYYTPLKPENDYLKVLK